jgi:hypothetical protein
MPASKTLFFGEPTRTMTYEEGLAFIERTRRQLDRYEVALPDGEVRKMTPKAEASIRRQLDELEADFRKDLEAI